MRTAACKKNRKAKLDQPGWQCEPPSEKELRRLAKYESEFKAWVVYMCMLPASWDWDNPMYPLWWFWNHFKDEFLGERQDDDDRRGRRVAAAIG
jgi:hypothetical protein